MIDGHDLKSVEMSNLHKFICLVPQNALIFDDTAAINIAYGAMKCASEAKITAAAQATHAISFIREMPEGLQTVIGNHGIKLNKTQSQHIVLARALLRNPAILILDEMPLTTCPSTDNHLMKKALSYLMQGRTTIILTQLQTSQLKVDRAYKLINGSIAEHAADSMKKSSH